MLMHNGPELFSNFLNGLIPRDFLKGITYPFQRVSQALVMVLLIDDIQSFSAGISSAARILSVRSYLDQAVILNQGLQTAVLRAEHATRLVPRSHISYPSTKIKTHLLSCTSG
jgi:hypothetical protein